MTPPDFELAKKAASELHDARILDLISSVVACLHPFNRILRRFARLLDVDPGGPAKGQQSDSAQASDTKSQMQPFDACVGLTFRSKRRTSASIRVRS